MKMDKLPNGIEVHRANVNSVSFAVEKGVNVRNGNWSVAYEMIGGAFDITYNSLSGYVGWFGFGWGSPFETRLIKMRDGTIYVQLNGSGSVATFGSGSAPRYASMMDDVVIKEAARTPDGSEVKIQKRLETQRDYAIEMAWKYGAISAPSVNIWKLDKDARNFNIGCDESGALIESPAGYVIKCGDHRILFDENGRLLSGESPTLGKFSIDYGSQRKPVKVRAEKTSFNFIWGDQGILQIVPAGRRPDELQYGPKNQLILLRQRDVGSTYKFEYNDRTDLTAIRYDDGTSKTLNYDTSDGVVSMTERNGEKTTFQFEREKWVDLYKWDFVSVLTTKPSGDSDLNVYRIAYP
jgi:YD repeat-containing protein